MTPQHLSEPDLRGARAGEPLEARLARVEDVEAVRRLVAHYADLCDRGYGDEPGIRERVADAVAALFVEDGTWESNVFGSYRGRAEVRGLIASIGGEVKWALHYLVSPAVAVANDGLTASGTWYLLELATMVGAGGGGLDAVVISAVYRMRFVKSEGRWRFQSVVADFQQVSNLDRGWVEQRFRGLAEPAEREPAGRSLDPVAFVRAYYEKENGRDLEAWNALVEDDALYTSCFDGPEPVTVRLKELILPMLETVEDMDVTLRWVVQTGDREATAGWSLAGTKPDGTPYLNEGIAQYRLNEAGRLVAATCYYLYPGRLAGIRIPPPVSSPERSSER